MTSVGERPPTGEQGEQHFSPEELLAQLEAIGKKAEDRFAAEHLDKEQGYRHHELPDAFDGVVPIDEATHTRANFHWNVRPVFNRPENRLPGGGLVVKSGEWDVDEESHQFLFARIIEGGTVDTQIRYYQYDKNGKDVYREIPLSDQTKLGMLHDALVKIEEAIDDPEATIDWHDYGRSYVW